MEDETICERPPVLETAEKASEAESTARPAPCGGLDPDETARPGGWLRLGAEELLAAVGARLEAREAAAREAELDALIIRHGGRPGSNVVPFPVDRLNRRK